MATVLDVIQETKRHLLGATRAEINVLDQSISASASQLTVRYEQRGISNGGVLSIGDELMIVVQAASTSKTVDVLRGQLGSVAAAHTAGDLVEVNPRFSTFTVRKTVEQEIKSWPEGLFAVDSTTISRVSGTRGYNLNVPEDFTQVLDVYAGPAAGDTENAWRKFQFHVQRGLPKTSFPSGTALVLHETPSSSSVLTVIYATHFDVSNMDDTVDLYEDMGIHEEAHDIPALGAAWRLMTEREAKRSFTEGQGEPRHAEEVPPGTALRAAGALLELRDRRLAEERGRLLARWPIRR